MPERTPRARSLSGAIAATERHNGPDDPRLPQLRRDLRAARAEDYIKRLVDEAPPLTAEQRATLAALLAPSTADGRDG